MTTRSTSANDTHHEWVIRTEVLSEMTFSSRRKGFSLVELLTVIAIIAILAAIIFPVMSMVKDRARQNDCMTKLQQIAMAVKMYKTDNNKYPEILTPVRAGEMMENAKLDAGLFASYVKTVKMFHCPSSKITNTTDIAEYPKLPYDDSSPTIASYAYNSYDCYVTGNPTGGVYSDEQVQRHYAPDWAPDVATVESGGLPPYGGLPNNTKIAQQDYERQLKFRTPPEDTVVTWCSWHESLDGRGGIDGKALVVFLDGSAASYQARDVEECRWRTRMKK